MDILGAVVQNIVDEFPVITSWAQLALVMFGVSLAYRFRKILFGANSGESLEAARLRAIAEIKGEIGVAKEYLRKEIDNTRHSLANSLAVSLGEFEETLRDGFQRLEDKLDAVEKAIRDSATRRRGYDK